MSPYAVDDTLYGEISQPTAKNLHRIASTLRAIASMVPGAYKKILLESAKELEQVILVLEKTN